MDVIQLIINRIYLTSILFGIINAATISTNNITPRLNNPATTTASRIIVESILKYSPSPPHTPANIRSPTERYNFFIIGSFLFHYFLINLKYNIFLNLIFLLILSYILNLFLLQIPFFLTLLLLENDVLKWHLI